MKRRDFNLAALASATLTACGGGGGGGSGDPAPAPAPGASPAPPPVAGGPVAGPAPAPAPVPAARTTAIGTNLPSMELTGDSAIRFGGSTLPNVNYAVPRKEDLQYLADNGFTKTRLPIRWEMLQPVLFDTKINAATAAIVGQPGAFHPVYDSFIQQTLDAHAAAGIQCILDVHNYCRYTDFIYQADGSVTGGLVKPKDPSVHVWANDPSQVTVRIMSLVPEKAPARTLSIAQYVDFMTRLIKRWKGHPGLGGIGTMNEPHWLPAKNGVDSSQFFEDAEDLTIWPTFAKAAILAMRQVDTETTIYLGGNKWSGSWSLPVDNPGFPIDAPNLVYEVHGYIDATNNGNGADWDLENSKTFPDGTHPDVAGLPGVKLLDSQTGVDRMKPAVAYAQKNNLRLALTETGMPIDDPRWQASWLNLLNYCQQNKIEVYSWGGGSFWAYQTKAINQCAGWHQNRTLEPQQAGPMKQAVNVWKASVFDDVAQRDPATGQVTITVYARGSLEQPVTLLVSSTNNTGTFSKTTLTIPAGANGSDSFTFTPVANSVTTLHYTSAFAPNVPPDRKVYALSDTAIAALAATNLADAAGAILAKYSASKWELADGYTDFIKGVASGTGQPIRAVAESGAGSTPGNAMDMVNWFTVGPNQNQFPLPVMQAVNAHRCGDFRAPNTFGLWCHKQLREPTQQPHALNVVPYHIDEPHFAIAAVAVPDALGNGAVFQASTGEHITLAELAIMNGKPAARWVDQNNVQVVVTSPTTLNPNQPAVISLLGAQGNQRLRVNSTPMGTPGTATLQSTPLGFDQMLLGSGFVSHFPQPSFGGYLFSAITGKGNPSVTEMAILEKYLATTAGLAL